MGGGVGLVACCDIALAATQTEFCLPELQLNLIPAIIMPYLISAIGKRRAQTYALTSQILGLQTSLYRWPHSSLNGY